MASAKIGGTQTIRRASLLVRAIAAHNNDGIRLTDLSQRLALDRTTVHRMLKALIAEGFVIRDAQTRRYYLGRLLFELGLSARRRFNVADLYRPVISRVADKIGDTVFLNIRSGNDAVCVERQHGSYPVRVFTLEPGDRRPLGTSASGIAILSAMPDAEIRRIVTENESALVREGKKPARLKSVLEAVRQTRERGYAFFVGDISDARTIAVPARSRTGAPFAALSVTAIPGRMTDDRQRVVASVLVDAAQDLERVLADHDISSGLDN